MRAAVLLFAALVALMRAATPAAAGALPEGFVHLSEIDPTIAQDMRYAGPDNFTGAPVPGYAAAECILARQAAEALARVQARMKAAGRSLIVLDCYRPARAVRHFAEWARRGGATRDPAYYPRVKRDRLVAEGYIAARSGHSSGGSVDLTFGVRDASGRVVPAGMGGGFDLFDRLSHTASGDVDAAARANRQVLVGAMQAEGFVNYRREWWHFRFAGEPFAGKAFDFPVTVRK